MMLTYKKISFRRVIKNQPPCYFLRYASMSCTDFITNDLIKSETMAGLPYPICLYESIRACMVVNMLIHA